MKMLTKFAEQTVDIFNLARLVRIEMYQYNETQKGVIPPTDKQVLVEI